LEESQPLGGPSTPAIEWILWNRDLARVRPEVATAVKDFDAGARPAAQAATEWLRDRSLSGESAAHLYLENGRVRGFYALAAGQVALETTDRRRLGLHYVTQPAFVVTWLAKAEGRFGGMDGERLLLHALGSARRALAYVGATVLALDPFDEETDGFWRNEYGFQPSARAPGGRILKRLWMPLDRS
jgi:hypothetical protein